jgi:hypothetical protein
MAKYELKTKKNNLSVSKFLNNIEDKDKRKDSKEIVKIIKEITKEKSKMWGSSIIGFGSYHYKYKSGQEGDWMLIGFSPRKQNLSLYVMSDHKNIKDLLDKLGPHKTGVSCIYIKKLEDIHIPTLKKIIRQSYKETKKQYK